MCRFNTAYKFFFFEKHMAYIYRDRNEPAHVKSAGTYRLLCCKAHACCTWRPNRDISFHVISAASHIYAPWAISPLSFFFLLAGNHHFPFACLRSGSVHISFSLHNFVKKILQNKILFSHKKRSYF